MASEDSVRNNHDDHDGRTTGIGSKSGYQLDDKQSEAVAVLANAHNYGNESKWKTFMALPAKEKWPFFVQHFLLGVVAIVVSVVVVVALVWQMVFNRVDSVIGVQGINMSQYADGFDQLKANFVKAEGVKDDRTVEIAAAMTITENGYSESSGMMDDSTKLVAMTSAGELNVMLANSDDVAMLAGQRGTANKASEVLNKQRLNAAKDAGLLVDVKGEPTDDITKAYGVTINADSSAEWAKVDGLPDEAVLMFSNVTEQEHKDWALKFYDFLINPKN
ncbi:hypothetical protein [Bifidobacterium oedipodis]|uniref:Uncharacterized protein n=1 Tax=Bifidobacterium oedipodis TaxID=2675322 RepID=A0A7Y0EQQ5_9BIFI|nr:hypothetical protein [Bifidobacterium sp. DSM 109957]NMM94599.1 hypothetical protein [Bifidobacterium sp. DSM 109957]